MNISRKYDQALKDIFSHPEMIVSLIKAFVTEEWVKNLDFSSLEPMKSEYITRDLKDRRQDLFWKIRSGEEWVYLLFLLEFQSVNNYFMANRILTYGSLAYEELIKNRKVRVSQFKLPPVFPLVFYTGNSPWRAPTEFKNCLHSSISPALMKYQFNAQYVVLDIGRLPLEKYDFSEDNLVVSLIGLERSRTLNEMNKAIRHAYERLIGKDASLKEAFEQYTLRALKAKEKYPNSQLDKLSENSMLYENADLIWDDCRQEALQEGRQEGRQQTLIETILVIYQQTHSTDAPPALKSKLQKMSSEQLLKSLEQMIRSKLVAKEIAE